MKETEIRRDLHQRHDEFLQEHRAYKGWVKRGLVGAKEASEDLQRQAKRLQQLALYAKDEIERQQSPLLITADMVTPAAIAIVASKSKLARKAIINGQPWVNKDHHTSFSPLEIGTTLSYAYEVAPELQAYWLKLRDYKRRLSMKQRRAKMREQFPGLRVDKINRRFGERHRTATDRMAEIVTASIVGLEPEVIRKKYRSQLRELRNLPRLERPSSRPR